MGPVFPPAEEFSGLRPFLLRLLSFAEVFQIQLIDMLKHADALSKLDVKERIVTGYQRSLDFLSFLDPRRLFFQIRIRIRIFFCVKLKTFRLLTFFKKCTFFVDPDPELYFSRILSSKRYFFSQFFLGLW